MGIKRFLAIILTTGLLLAACGPNRGASLKASASMEEGRISVHLHGYWDQERPKLSVTGSDGKDWSTGAFLSMTDAGWMGFLALGQYPHIVAEQLTFTWETPEGQAVSHEVFYTNPRTSLPWRVTLTDRLAIYHVNRLGWGTAREWEKAYDRLLSWSGLEEKRGRVPVYLFPDHDALSDAWRLLHRQGEAASFFVDGRGYLTDQKDKRSLLPLLILQLARALGVAYREAWAADGFGRFLAMKESGRLAGAGHTVMQDVQYRVRTQLEELVRLARSRRLLLADPARNQPPEPWAIGYSFALFVRARYGDEGVHTLLRRSAGSLGVVKAAEHLFDMPVAQVEEEWNEYLKSGKILEHHDQIRYE